MTCRMAALGAPVAIPAVIKAIIGATDAKVTPIMIGNLTPTNGMPRAWIRVAMPHASKSALISTPTSAGDICRARPMISGTATAPAYMTRTCCRPSAISLCGGKI